MSAGLAQLITTAKPSELHIERCSRLGGATARSNHSDRQAGTGLQQGAAPQGHFGHSHDYPFHPPRSPDARGDRIMVGLLPVPGNKI
jgi:hypothetical protein